MGAQGLRSVAGAVATGGALLKEAQQTRPGMESFPPGEAERGARGQKMAGDRGAWGLHFRTTA